MSAKKTGAYTLVFVEQGEVRSTSIQRAYEETQAAETPCKWISEEDCFKYEGRDPKSIFIFDSFEGEAFKHIVSSGNRVFGPMCILSCSRDGKLVPKQKHPVFSMAMSGLTVCCTSVEKAVRERCHEKIEWMCGAVSRDFHDQVTHLIAGEVGTKKYLVAANLKKKIMSAEWVERVWESSKTQYIKADDEEFKKYRCPVAQSLVVTVSGLDTAERTEIRDLVEREGGRYSGEMKINECTHLIIKKPKGTKYEFAKKWGLNIVSPQWLYDSVNSGYCQEVHKYKVVEGQPDENKTLKTSTPTKQGKVRPSLADVSMISHGMTHINETAMTTFNVTGVPSAVNSDFEDIDLVGIKADTFLDGCKIFLSGFNIKQLEKLRKIINIGGGTRFNSINPSVSHVVMGNQMEEHITMMKENNLRPHIVNVHWLIDCLQQRQHLNEEPYQCCELPGMDSASPLPKSRKSLSRTMSTQENTTICANDANEETVNPAAEMQDIMSQYLPSHMTDDSAMIRAAEAGEQMQQNQPENAEREEPPAPVDRDTTVAPGEDTTMEQDNSDCSNLFRGKTFVIFGFPELEYETQIEEMIAETGGTVLKLPCRAVPDYAIVPSFGCDVTVAVNEVVTVTWLQMCIDANPPQLLDIQSNELFTPLTFKPDMFPLKDCVVSLSGYAGIERDVLMSIAEELGATCQEYFAKKARDGVQPSTHLIVMAPEGSKYKAAKNWNIPAVTKQWLFECTRTGDREPEELFLIDNPLHPSHFRNKSSSILAQSVNVSTVSNSTRNLPAAKTPAREPKPSTSGTPQATKIPTFKTPASVSKSVTKTPVASSTPAGPTSGAHFKTPIMPKSPGSETSDAQSTPVNIRLRDVAEEEQGSVEKAKPGAARDPEFVTPGRPAGRNKLTTGGKENAVKTPVQSQETPKAVSSRVKALQGEALKTSPAVAVSPTAHLGIDSPSVYLNPEKPFYPKFDLADTLEFLKTPEHEKIKNRRESTPLHELYAKHIALALENCKTSQCAKANPATPAPVKTKPINWPEEPTGPLKGVIIAVGRKLIKKQNEYNTLAASLGADYRWTYDPSCTHYIFEGRNNDMNKEFRTARDQGICIVSPHWLYMCQEQSARVDESLFPHTFNPSLTLWDVVSLKQETPARSTRKSTRSRTQQKSSPEPETRKGRKRKEEKSEEEKSSEEEKKSSEDEKKSRREKVTKEKSGGESSLSEEDVAKGGQQENQGKSEDLVNNLKNLMAATRTYSKTRRRGSRRTDSLPDESKNDSKHEKSSKAMSEQEDSCDSWSSRSSIRNRITPLNPETQVESSQNVEVTWDDPAAREHQEKMAQELAKNSESFSPKAHHLSELQHNLSDEDIHLGLKPKRSEQRLSAEKEARVPTPEPPPLAFPVRRKSTEAVPKVDLTTRVEAASKKKPVFLLSGFPQEDRSEFGALVERLGGEMSDKQHFENNCTHLVADTPNRTEKFLGCIAAGKWVLHKSYFVACQEQGRFVEEEPHEWGGEGTESILPGLTPQLQKLARAAHRWRVTLAQMRQEQGDPEGAFEGWRVAIFHDKRKIEGFVRLLEAGGATVAAVNKTPVPDVKSLTHAFMDLSKINFEVNVAEFTSNGIPCLKADYLAAYLSENPKPSIRAYTIPELQPSQGSSSRKRSGSTSATPSKRSRKN